MDKPNVDHAVTNIVDMMVILADGYSTHPDPVARLHSISMLVDAEIFKRMKNTNQDTRHSYDG